uniref:Uncharacterized protein n=1 Tax=Rhizophora mucronata TaxID=61149 RepID=A0A2P2PMV9_RHIMU
MAKTQRQALTDNIHLIFKKPLGHKTNNFPLVPTLIAPNWPAMDCTRHHWKREPGTPNFQTVSPMSPIWAMMGCLA